MAASPVDLVSQQHLALTGQLQRVWLLSLVLNPGKPRTKAQVIQVVGLVI